MKNIIHTFTDALVSMDRLGVRKILEQHTPALAPIAFVEKVLVPSLERIGSGWREGNFALSQVYMAAKICEELVDEILPPGDPHRKNQPRIAICVLGDHHQLGKTIVAAILRASGFDLSDYGVMGIDGLVERVRQDHIEILLISVLMLPSALKIRTLKEKLVQNGLHTRIIVGGAPFRFDDRLWETVGADAMCKDASEAAAVIGAITGGKS